jgi:ribose 5-phosphate isomerase B
MKRHLMHQRPELPWQDLGTFDSNSVDYPDYADKVALALQDAPEGVVGVLVCGSGQGMSIRANRHKHIRAALCWSEDVARLARQHNDANILCLAGRMTLPTLAERILQTFLTSQFEGGRHQTRVDKLSKP